MDVEKTSATYPTITGSAGNYGDKGLQYLTNMKQRRDLRLNGTRVTGEGFMHLQKLTKLDTLVLNSTAIDDRALASLGTITQLQELWLTDANITDRGLALLHGLTNLTRLVLSRTKVTDKGVQGLSTGPSQLQDLEVTSGKAVPGIGIPQRLRPSCLGFENL
jgi:Leucine-rich repeat (LRR) protein